MAMDQHPKPAGTPSPPPWITRFAASVLQWEQYLSGDHGNPTSLRRYVAAGIWISCVVALAVIVRVTGFPVMWEKLNDVLVILDTAWRVWNGQVPHRDFYSVIGPFPLGVFALAFVLNHQDISGFPQALLLAGIGFSALSWLASRDRLTIWWRLIVAFVVLLLPVAPVFLGGGEDLGGGKGPPFGFAAHTSYAMLYNRLGWTVFVLQMLIMLIPRRHAETLRQVIQDAALGGLLMGFSVFCKINYLLAAVALSVWWICRCQDRGWRICGVLAGLFLATAILALFPGGVLEYFGDQWRLLHVSRSESHLESLLVRLYANWPWLLILVILQVSMMAGCQSRATGRTERSEIHHLALNFLAAIALTSFVMTFNTQRGEVPGLFIAGLITVEMARRTGASSRVAPSAGADGGMVAKGLVLKLCCLVMAGSALCYDGGSWAYALLWKLRKPRWADESERLTGLLSPLPVPVYFNEPTEKDAVERAIVRRRSGPWMDTGTDNFMTPLQTVRWVNDGVALLAGRIKPTDRIFVVAWFNPFNLALHLPPARGGAMHWDWDRVVDGRIHPDVGRTLAGVTLFMVPKRADWLEQREFMLKTYGQSLGQDFHIVGESQFWTCWGR